MFIEYPDFTSGLSVSIYAEYPLKMYGSRDYVIPALKKCGVSSKTFVDHTQLIYSRIPF